MEGMTAVRAFYFCCHLAFFLTNLSDPVFFEIVLRTLAGDHLEVLMEAGEIVEPALITQLLDADPVVDEQLAGMSYPDLRQELGIGLAGPGFEITAERVGDQSGYGSYLFQVNFLVEIRKGIVIYRIDPVIFLFGEIVPETNRRKYLQVIHAGKG